MKSTLRFSPRDGRVDCLYTEAVDLRTLGNIRVTRATDIRFLETSQQWQVHEEGTNRLLFSHQSRDQCLVWENENLQPGETEDAANKRRPINK